jgi:uncharacterized protein YjbI with pentapeptide repeats
LHNSTLQGSASFRGSNFGEVDFERTSFYNATVFNEAIFQNNVDFKYTNFDDRVYFQDVTIQGELNLSSTIFKDEVNFLGIKNNEVGKKLGVKNIANRETARIIKHSFEKLNNIIEANKFYALEMEAMWKELKFRKQPLNWIIFFLHGLSSNHSQNYLLPVLWISIISFAFCNGCSLIKASLMETIFGIYNSNIIKCMTASIVVIEKESLTFGALMYKSIIAYLIYQFIVSVRQNTRRK